jgi:hypothetical protein
MFPHEQFAGVIIMCEDHMKDVEKGNYIDDDFYHYLYEEVMSALYGSDVFKWINKQNG